MKNGHALLLVVVVAACTEGPEIGSPAGNPTHGGAAPGSTLPAQGGGGNSETPAPGTSSGQPDSGGPAGPAGPAGPSTPTAHFALLPPGAALPSGADCAQRIRRSTFEPRPQNAKANKTEGTSGVQISAASAAYNAKLAARIDGHFTGTTDEIIQWGACKWGFDEDYVRAVAITESNWIQSVVGDGGESFGLLQVRQPYHLGTFPLSRDSTAFNVDYTLASRRSCFDGDLGWLQNVEHEGNYVAGDEWGCAGVWFAGRWYTQPAKDYIATAKKHLADKPWATPGF